MPPFAPLPPKAKASDAYSNPPTGKRETAVATTTADGLGEDTVRLQAGDGVAVARIDIRVIGDIDHSAIASLRAGAAHRKADRSKLRTARRGRETAVAAAATDRLREYAIGFVTRRGDRAETVDRDIAANTTAPPEPPKDRLD